MVEVFIINLKQNIIKEKVDTNTKISNLVMNDMVIENQNNWVEIVNTAKLILERYFHWIVFKVEMIDNVIVANLVFENFGVSVINEITNT